MNKNNPVNPAPVFFRNSSEFREWLLRNHDKEREVWVGYYKTGSGKTGIIRSESIDEALCFGWIDGIGKRIDDERYMVRFSPRKPNSIWSKINVGKVERLTAEGKMTPAGLKAVEAGKASGAWDSAYRQKDSMELPPDFEEALNRNPVARRNFRNYSNSNQFIFIYRIAKIKNLELRASKIKKAIALIEENLKPNDSNREPLI